MADFARGSFHGDEGDFDQGILGDAGRLNGFPGRVRLTEVAGIDLVKSCKIVDIFKVDGHLHHMGEAAAGGIQDGLQIGEDQMRLCSKPPGNCPVLGSMPICPDTNSKSLRSTAWE